MSAHTQHNAKQNTNTHSGNLITNTRVEEVVVGGEGVDVGDVGVSGGGGVGGGGGGGGGAEAALRACGLTPPVARSLCHSVDAATVARYVEAYRSLARRGKVTGPGWLVKAISQRWDVGETAAPAAPARAAPAPAPVTEPAEEFDGRGRSITQFVAEFRRLAALPPAQFGTWRRRFGQESPEWAAALADRTQRDVRLLAMMAEHFVDGLIEGPLPDEAPATPKRAARPRKRAKKTPKRTAKKAAA